MFLENDVYHKPPWELNLYGPYQNQEELEFDLLGGPLWTVRAPKPAKSKHEPPVGIRRSIKARIVI